MYHKEKQTNGFKFIVIGGLIGFFVGWIIFFIFPTGVWVAGKSIAPFMPIDGYIRSDAKGSSLSYTVLAYPILFAFIGGCIGWIYARVNKLPIYL